MIIELIQNYRIWNEARTPIIKKELRVDTRRTNTGFLLLLVEMLC